MSISAAKHDDELSGILGVEPFLYAQWGRLDGSPGTWASTEIVRYNFSGFFNPVENEPVVNTVIAGAAVPVKFSLDGDQGLDIFQEGFPASQPIACDSFETLAPIEATVTAGRSGLSYDASGDQYTYVWKTQKSWSGTCQQLVLRLADGSFHTLKFHFR